MDSTTDFSSKLVKVFNYSLDIKEVIEIDNVGFGRKGGRVGRKSGEVSAEDRERNIKRIKRNCRRLALANGLTIHLVLTYRENMQDVDKADNHFKKFIYELRNIYPGLKYLATRELQNRGAIHYHVLINQRLDHKKAHETWGHGFIKLIQHSNKVQSIMYVLKYIGKEVGETIMITSNGHTKKAYLSSQGLKRELDNCTLRYVIAEPEHYVHYQDRLSMMMTNLTEGWDLEFEIDIKSDKPIKGRSILRCASDNY